MANITSTLTVNAPGGRNLNAGIIAPAGEVIDQTIQIPSGDFMPLLQIDTAGGVTAQKKVGSINGFKQLNFHNTGDTPAEISIQVPHYEADGTIGATVSVLTNFFLPPSTFLSIPSPRVSVCDYAADPESRNQYKNCTPIENVVAVGGDTSYWNGTEILRLLSNGTTNDNGQWRISDIGAETGFTITNGIVPGTFRTVFYEKAYQVFDYNLNTRYRPQVSTTSSQLTGNQKYSIKIGIDGATATEINFTTHSTDVTWGNPTTGNGVLKKLQDAITLAEIPVSVALVQGDVRFTRETRNAGGAVAITDGTTAGSAEPILGEGTIPSAASAAVATLPNFFNNAGMLYDDGQGKLIGNGSGTIDYETGDIYISNAPGGSSMQISYFYNAPLAGALDSTAISAAGSNCVMQIFGRGCGFTANDIGVYEAGTDPKKATVRILAVQ